jgi:hypothetical protein
MNETLEDLATAPGPLHGELAWLAHALEWASTAIDLVAIAIMLIGAVRFTLGFAAAEVRGQSPDAPMAYGRNWGNTYNTRDWERFYHYPYVYYPQNFWGNEYYRSSDNLYHRYPPEMQIPVYNKKWHNEFPQPRRYHWGHHFILDQF